MNKNFNDGLSIVISNIARIHSNIRYADAKSGVVLLINMGLLKAVYEILQDDKCSDEIIPYLLIIPSGILLLCGVVLCVWVIKPRGDEYSKDRGIGLVDPVRINQYKSASEYILAIEEVDSNKVFDNAYELLWDLSRIDRSKYEILRMALFFSMVAWLSFLFLLAEVLFKSQ